MTFTKNFRPWLITYLTLFSLFAFLRFYQLTARPMHNDEGVNGFFTNNLIKSNSYQYDPTNYHGPTLYYFQLIPSWVCNFLKNPLRFHFNDSSGLTVFSVRFTIACVSLLALTGFLFCIDLIGRWGSLAALLLAGTSCNFLFYSRYFIHETYVVLFTFGLLLSLVYLKHTRRAAYFYGAVISAMLLFCTKETGLLHMLVLGAAGLGALLVHSVLAGDSPKEAVIHLWKTLRFFLKPTIPHFSYSAVIAAIIWGLFFSSFLKNPHGLKDSFVAYLPWAQQGLKSGHAKVWSYFIAEMIAPYESALVVFAVIGTAVSIIKNETRGLFLSLWWIGLLGIYSVIPYKTPWCSINFIFPMALAAGYGVQGLVDWCRLIQHPISKKRALVVVAFIFISLIAVQFPNTWTINYKEWDNDQHKQIYVHTSRDMFRLLNTIEDIGKKSGEGKTILINDVAPEYWPIPFYLKDYPSAKFWGKASGVGALDAPLLISIPNQHTEVRNQLHDSYSIQNFFLRPGYILDLWINNNILDDILPASTVPDLLIATVPKKPLISGLTYKLFAGLSCDGTPVKILTSNTATNFYFDSDSQKPMTAPFMIQWTGFLKIPKSGIYRFHLNSDDGSRLKLDNLLVIDNSGNHPLTRRSRGVNLSQGAHVFELLYSDTGGFAELSLVWTPPGRSEELIPTGLFSSYKN